MTGQIFQILAFKLSGFEASVFNFGYYFKVDRSYDL